MPRLAGMPVGAGVRATKRLYNAFSPAWGQCDAEQIWGQAHADVIKNGMTPAAAIDKAFKRCNQIFARIVI